MVSVHVHAYFVPNETCPLIEEQNMSGNIAKYFIVSSPVN